MTPAVHPLVAEVSNWFKNPRPGRNGIMVQCPAHEDTRQSLHVSVGDRGAVILHCFAGCETADILDRVGKTFADLTPAPTARRSTNDRYDTITYDYRETDSDELLFQAVRKQFPDHKEFFQRKPKAGGGWDYSLSGVRRVLYNQSAVRAAITQRQPVVIVEGEKDVETLRRLGIVGTTNVGGAGKWRAEYSLVLAGADVVLIPDNDAPGTRHMAQVAESVSGHARRVRILRIMDLPEKSDISETRSPKQEARPATFWSVCLWGKVRPNRDSCSSPRPNCDDWPD